MPHTDVVQQSQRPTLTHAKHSFAGRTLLLGNSHDECIDPSSPQDRPLRIRQSAHTCLIIVTCHHEVHLRLRSCISSMASEHDQLVQIRIALDIVRQRRHTQLQQASAHSPHQQSTFLSPSARLSCPSLAQRSTARCTECTPPSA